MARGRDYPLPSERRQSRCAAAEASRKHRLPIFTSRPGGSRQKAWREVRLSAEQTCRRRFGKLSEYKKMSLWFQPAVWRVVVHVRRARCLFAIRVSAICYRSRPVEYAWALSFINVMVRSLSSCCFVVAIVSTILCCTLVALENATASPQFCEFGIFAYQASTDMITTVERRKVLCRMGEFAWCSPLSQRVFAYRTIQLSKFLVV